MKPPHDASSSEEAFSEEDCLFPKEAWVELLGADPRAWLLASDEPATRWVTLTGLLDLGEDDPRVRDVRASVLADPGTRGLVDRLPEWDTDACASGHNSPAFAPNLLHLLADMGVRASDFPRVGRELETMLAHQDPEGRFASYGRARSSEPPSWGALLCDSHAITEVLVRYGHAGDVRVEAALGRMARDLADTAQGRAWLCRPDPATGFRGPGRSADCCLQVTLEALRTMARLPPTLRDGLLSRSDLLQAAEVVVRAWRVRGTEKPYMFGHGSQFKTVKWPPFWYGSYWVLDTVGRYPELWRCPGAAATGGSDATPARGTAWKSAAKTEAAGPGAEDKTTEGEAAPAADPADRRAAAELAACLVAYNFGQDGTVTPRSCFKGFESFSFGQKKRPSPFATARLAVVLRRFNDLVPEIAAVDVTQLASSKGGTGTARPPKQTTV